MIVNQFGAHDEGDADEGSRGVKCGEVGSSLFVFYCVIGDDRDGDEEGEGGGDGEKVSETFHDFVGKTVVVVSPPRRWSIRQCRVGIGGCPMNRWRGKEIISKQGIVV